MNNGYNQNRGDRQIPRQGNDPRRAVQNPQARSAQSNPRDPRMAQSQRPVQSGRVAPQRQPQQRPAPRAGRQMPRQDARSAPAPQPQQNRQRPATQTRSMNDTHRKATREQLRADNRRRRKEARKTFLGRLALYGITLLVLAGIVFGISACMFYSTPDENENTINFIEKYDGKTGVSSKISGDLAYRNGALYLNFSSLAEGCSMSVISDSASAKFILPDNGDTSDSAGTGHEEYVTFIKDSTEISVCGQDFRLSDIAVFSEDNVWVPADFVINYVNGITVTEEKDDGNVYITRDREDSEDDESPLAEVSFRLKAATAPSPTEPPEGEVSDMPEVSFTGDLSAYEKYMNPSDASAYLILVNKTNSVNSNHVPDDLVAIANTRDDGRATQKMRTAAAKALDAMFIEMKAAGYTDVSVTSAYRSYEYQKQLYDGYVSSMGQEEADKISAKPGTSEHQTGLCADLHNLPSADKAFANEQAYKWLCDNAWKFGFILRFPENKTEITGYDFEPWHYRFVGREAAWQIHNAGICLEEYVANH